MLPGDQRKQLTSNVLVNVLDANFRFDLLRLSNFGGIEFQGGSIFRKLPSKAKLLEDNFVPNRIVASPGKVVVVALQTAHDCKDLNHQT